MKVIVVPIGETMEKSEIDNYINDVVTRLEEYKKSEQYKNLILSSSVITTNEDATSNKP